MNHQMDPEYQKKMQAKYDSLIESGKRGEGAQDAEGNPIKPSEMGLDVYDPELPSKKLNYSDNPDLEKDPTNETGRGLNPDKVGLIYQPCGLGDILFLQKAAYYIQNELGYPIYWPVVHEFAWLEEHIPDFNWVSWGDTAENKITGPPLPDSCQFPYKEEYIHGAPTKQTDLLYFFQGFGDYQPIMGGKYDSIGLDYSDWRQYVYFQRNEERENALKERLGVPTDGTEYVFVNRLWCTRPQVETYGGISVDPADYGGKVVIENQIIEGFTMFDWCAILEGASEIHMVETALCYMMESVHMFVQMKEKPLHLYHRYGDWSQVRYLFELPWIYH